MDSESKERKLLRITELLPDEIPCPLSDNPNFYYVVFYVKDTGVFLIHGCHARNHADAFKQHPVCLFSDYIGYNLLDGNGFFEDRSGMVIPSLEDLFFLENFDLDFIGVFSHNSQSREVILTPCIRYITGHVPFYLKDNIDLPEPNLSHVPDGYWFLQDFYYKSFTCYSNLSAGYLPLYMSAPRDNTPHDKEILFKYKMLRERQYARYYVKPEADRARELFPKWMDEKAISHIKDICSDNPELESIISSAFFGFINRIQQKEYSNERKFLNLTSPEIWDKLFPYISGAEPWSV